MNKRDYNIKPTIREHTQSDVSAIEMLKISLAHIIDLCLLYGECRFIVIYSVYIVYKKLQAILAFSSFPARGDFCRLLIAFANIFDPDQLPHNGLIWININGHFDGTSEIFLRKKKETELVDDKTCKIICSNKK